MLLFETQQWWFWSQRGLRGQNLLCSDVISLFQRQEGEKKEWKWTKENCIWVLVETRCGFRVKIIWHWRIFAFAFILFLFWKDVGLVARVRALENKGCQGKKKLLFIHSCGTFLFEWSIFLCFLLLQGVRQVNWKENHWILLPLDNDANVFLEDKSHWAFSLGSQFCFDVMRFIITFEFSGCLCLVNRCQRMAFEKKFGLLSWDVCVITVRYLTERDPKKVQKLWLWIIVNCNLIHLHLWSELNVMSHDIMWNVRHGLHMTCAIWHSGHCRYYLLACPLALAPGTWHCSTCLVLPHRYL